MKKSWDRVLLMFVRHLSYMTRFQHRVGNSHPLISGIIFLFTSKAYIIILNTLAIFKPYNYTNSNPYKIIYVNPSKIENYTIPTGSRRRGWVVSGDWDKEVGKFMNRDAAKSISKIHYNKKLGDLDDIKNSREDKINDEIKIYTSINKNGYLSQSYLLKNHPEIAWRNLNDVMHPCINEVGVDIGRNGELLWHMGGQHRLAAAKVLNIDKIPVQVYRRHEEWEKVRRRAEKYGLGKIKSEFRQHPDLNDINYK